MSCENDCQIIACTLPPDVEFDLQGLPPTPLPPVPPSPPLPFGNDAIEFCCDCSGSICGAPTAWNGFGVATEIDDFTNPPQFLELQTDGNNPIGITVTGSCDGNNYATPELNASITVGTNTAKLSGTFSGNLGDAAGSFIISLKDSLLVEIAKLEWNSGQLGYQEVYIPVLGTCGEVVELNLSASCSVDSITPNDVEFTGQIENL